MKKLDAPDSSVAEFIRLANVPYNISWQKKNIETIEFDHLGKSPYSFVGTLRPLYAQDLQRTILTDLGRVGLSVAPAMGVSARATVFLRTDNGNPKEMPLGNPKAADCYVIPGRGGDDKPIVLFKRSFAAHLVQELSKQDAAGLHASTVDGIAAASAAETLAGLSKMHRDGVRFGELIDDTLKIPLLNKNPPQDGTMPWCFIKTEVKDLPS